MAGNVFSSIALSSSSGGSATSCAIVLRYGSSYSSLSLHTIRTFVVTSPDASRSSAPGSPLRVEIMQIGVERQQRCLGVRRIRKLAQSHFHSLNKLPSSALTLATNTLVSCLYHSLVVTLPHEVNMSKRHNFGHSTARITIFGPLSSVHLHLWHCGLWTFLFTYLSALVQRRITFFPCLRD